MNEVEVVKILKKTKKLKLHFEFFRKRLNELGVKV